MSILRARMRALNTYFNKVGFVGLLDLFPDAAAAYSLRKLRAAYSGSAVRVLRSSDNTEQDIGFTTQGELDTASLLSFVNEDVLFYQSDFSSDTDGWGGSNIILTAPTTIDGVDGALRSELTGGNVGHQTNENVGFITDSVSYKISFDYYIPSTNSVVNSIGLTEAEEVVSVLDEWTSHETDEFVPTSTFARFRPNGFQFLPINADGDVFYLKNIVITQTTADGHVNTWYDQSGNSNDATQGTAAEQPKIVSSGSVIEYNGNPFIEYDGTNDNLGIASLTATGTMLMSDKDNGAFYEVDISGAYDLLASANNTDYPLTENVRIIWDRSLSESEKTSVESLASYTGWGDFGDVSTFTNYWRDRSEIDDFPLLDVSSGTDFGSAWWGCSSLASFPELDVSIGTDFRLAWRDCSSLESFPQLDVSSGNDFAAAWQNCSLLESFPELDVSSSTDFFRTWEGCSLLESFPANFFDGCSATNFADAFQNTNLTQQSIDDILVSIESNGTSNGTFDQSGGNAPSATGEAAIDDLRSRGWTVTVTGGY